MQQRSVQPFCNDHAVLHVRDILHQLEKQTDDSKHRKQTAKHSSQTCLYCNVGRLLLVQHCSALVGSQAAKPLAPVICFQPSQMP